MILRPEQPKPVEDKKPQPSPQPKRQLGPTETRIIVSTLVFTTGYAYYSVMRGRLVPKTIKRLKDGFYPYHWSHLTYKHIYRMNDLQTVEQIIKSNRHDPKYYLITGQKGNYKFKTISNHNPL